MVEEIIRPHLLFVVVLSLALVQELVQGAGERATAHGETPSFIARSGGHELCSDARFGLLLCTSSTAYYAMTTTDMCPHRKG
jgi:hypothetical protein